MIYLFIKKIIIIRQYSAACLDLISAPYPVLSRATMCWAQSIWHKAPNTQLLGWHQKKKSRALSVFWREPSFGIRFQMCAIWLITSVSRIKLWFSIILFSWLSISEHFSESRVNNLQFLSSHRTALMNNGLKGSHWKITNIPTLIIAGVLPKPDISNFCPVYFLFIAVDCWHYLPCAEKVS